MLRSLCKVHRWWMSFLPYRSLSLMIPPTIGYPGSVWRALTPVAPTEFLADLVVLHRRSRAPLTVAERDQNARRASCLNIAKSGNSSRRAPGTASCSPSPRPDGGTPSSRQESLACRRALRKLRARHSARSDLRRSEKRCDVERKLVFAKGYVHIRANSKRGCSTGSFLSST